MFFFKWRNSFVNTRYKYPVILIPFNLVDILFADNLMPKVIF